MATWPPALVAELAARRCVVVIGSGLSATASCASGERPPTWGALIGALAAAASDDQARDRIREQLDSKNFVGAAEELRRSADRQSLALEFRRALVDPQFRPSQAHADLMSIDQPVVITLNYDKVYENHCVSLAGDDYMVVDNNSGSLVRAIRGPARIVLKFHGTVDDADSAIFSLSDYNRLRSENKEVIDVLNALFLTRTVLFIGCGFNGDPDVEYILSESGLRVPGAFPHYALVPDTVEGDSAFATARAQGLNITFVRYDTTELADGGRDHSAFGTMISELKDAVLATRELGV